jgi:hypothetical protein
VVLNYLRTRTLTLPEGADVRQLLHEAEYYGVTPLVRQLTLCSDLQQNGCCGDVLFYTYLAPPLIPGHELKKKAANGLQQQHPTAPPRGHSRNSSLDSSARAAVASRTAPPPRPPPPSANSHSRNSSADLTKKNVADPVGLLFNSAAPPFVDPLRVQIVTAHHNCIAVAYAHFVTVFKVTNHH